MALSFKADLILLGNSIELHQGAADPSAGGGVAAPVGSFYYRTSTSTLWQKVGSPNTAWVYLTPRDIFATGSDGDLLVNGGTTTAAADGVYNDVHVTSTGIWKTGGFRHWIRGQLLIDAGGVVHNDGNDAASSTGATGGAAVTVGTTATADGGNGGAIGSPGSLGTSRTQCPASFTGTGGAGGAGNAGANGGGGGGTITAMLANRGRVRNFTVQQIGQGFSSTANQSALGAGAGGGGGGGGSAGTAAGGGGGGGGGFVALTAREIINNGILRSKGGNGFSPAVGSPGGGGGGGGGVVWLAYHYFEGNAPSVVGGTKGTATGNGANGVDGGSGLVIGFQM
jgi:hypothetical protein